MRSEIRYISNTPWPFQFFCRAPRPYENESEGNLGSEYKVQRCWAL